MTAKILLFCLFLFVTGSTSAQKRIVGQIVNARTQTGLPFATIRIQHTTTGTTADSMGRFILIVPGLASELTINALGYEPLHIRAADAQLILLSESHQYLNEVTVRSINPAHRIIQQAVINLPRNDPEQLQSFTYEAYHVSTIGSAGSQLTTSTRNKRISRLAARLDTSYLSVNESYSTRQFLAPDLTQEVITASHTSGSKSTLFASLRPLLEPFGVNHTDYNDQTTKS